VFQIFTGVVHADETKSMKGEEFISQYENALATQNWKIVEPLIHKKCSVTFSNGKNFQGKEQVRGAFQKNFELSKSEAYEISEVKWVTKGESFAVFTFCYSWSGIINGKKASGSGRGTSAIVLKDVGWRLLAEHLGPKL